MTDQCTFTGTVMLRRRRFAVTMWERMVMVVARATGAPRDEVESLDSADLEDLFVLAE